MSYCIVLEEIHRVVGFASGWTATFPIQRLSCRFCLLEEIETVVITFYRHFSH